MFTSGTTGMPKAALHTHNTAWSAGRPLPEAIELTADDVCFMASTVGHLTGFFWGTYLPLAVGQKVVYQDVWDTRRLLDIVVPRTSPGPCRRRRSRWTWWPRRSWRRERCRACGCSSAAGTDPAACRRGYAGGAGRRPGLQRTRFPSRPDVVMPVAAIRCSARALLGRALPSGLRGGLRATGRS